jgi:putative transposase
MNRFKKLAHATYECKYHLVWCPKYRFRVLTGDVGRSVRELIRQLCEWRKFEIMAGRVMSDHIHIVLSIPPKYAVSDAVGFIKGKSAIKMFDKHQDLKKRYWGRHFWAKGYCVSTVGLNERQIKEYVEKQLEHDRKLDERKLWDK